MNKITGIYMILNHTNDKIYIGQSIDIKTRWKQHKSNLNCNRHENKHLQSAWDKYGKDKFEIQLNANINNCDIIHSHTVEPRNYIKMKRAKVPTVAYVHFLPDTLDGSIKLPKFAFKIFKKYVISFYKNEDHLVVVNPIFKKDMVKAGLDENKITYIPNFVSKEKFYKMNDKDRKKARIDFNIKENEFVVIGAGQVQTRKGVKDFVEVAKKTPDIKRMQKNLCLP